MKTFRSLVVGLAVGFVLGGCAPSPTFLAPGSMVAAREASLYRIITYMAAGVFVLVEGLLLYNILRYRQRRGDTAVPKQIYGNSRLEFIWTAIPVVLVGLLFVLTVETMQAVAAPPAAPSDLNVHVVGHQWWWEFDYPDLGIITANELHVPQGQVVQMTLDSVDVIHSFWVPQLSSKIDVIPGQTNHLWFKPDTVGAFHGQCAEFCGLNHANMRIKVVVDSPQDFQAWVANQQQPPAQPQSDLEAKGQKLVTGGLCSNCHVLGTSGPEAPVGPNLTHLMSRSVFAGATFDLNEDNLRRWLKDTQALKPGNDMVVSLNDDDINALMAYLKTLK